MDWASASEIASAVANGERSALAVTEAALGRIKSLNRKLNVFCLQSCNQAFNTKGKTNSRCFWTP